MSKVKNIGVFGRRNSGKSSLINSVIGQTVAIVSDTPGTTTDPVRKRIEIFGIGPVNFIDTAGIDDVGELGFQRVKRSKAIMNQIDLALLLFTNNTFNYYEIELIESFRKLEIPIILVHNQSDIISLDSNLAGELASKYGVDVVSFSSNHIDEDLQQKDIQTLTYLIVNGLKSSTINELTMFEGLLKNEDVVVLVCPVDSEAPEGRLILPQQNAIREVLDNNGVAIVLQPQNLESYFSSNRSKPKLVVTDSQAFETVNKLVPQDIPLTGFSILLARAKGDFESYLKGTPTIDSLPEGAKVLILESCTHHSTCDDIGTNKLPKLLSKRTGKTFEFVNVSGLDDLPNDPKEFDLVIHCGACMITHRQLLNRLRVFTALGVPVTNYGMALAWCNGIYDRAINLFI